MLLYLLPKYSWKVYCPHLEEEDSPIGTLKLTIVPKIAEIKVKGQHVDQIAEITGWVWYVIAGFVLLLMLMVPAGIMTGTVPLLSPPPLGFGAWGSTL